MSPELELQGEIVNLLRTDATVKALVGQRVYDQIPDGSEFPYVSLGPTITTSEEIDCIDSMDISLQIDCWSREVGFPEVKTIADAVRSSVQTLEELPVNSLVRLLHTITTTMRDPDGLTSHSVLIFDALVERQ